MSTAERHVPCDWAYTDGSAEGGALVVRRTTEHGQAPTLILHDQAGVTQDPLLFCEAALRGAVSAGEETSLDVTCIDPDSGLFTDTATITRCDGEIELSMPGLAVTFDAGDLLAALDAA